VYAVAVHEQFKGIIDTATVSFPPVSGTVRSSGVNVKLHDSKVAVQVLGPFMSTLIILPVPKQSPLQSINPYPENAVAVSRTIELFVKFALQG
jgi:hypothetical protein